MVVVWILRYPPFMDTDYARDHEITRLEIARAETSFYYRLVH